MHEFLILVLRFALGFLLGMIFFGGLWWTIQKGLASSYPAFWFLSSFLLRISLTLTGFYFVSAHHWEYLLLCLLGFIVARLTLTQLMKKPIKPLREVCDAPKS